MDVVLAELTSAAAQCCAVWSDESTHLDRHLIDMDALFNSKVRYDDIEGLVEDTDDGSLPLDRSVLLGEVRDEGAQIQVLGHLLSKLGCCFLRVAVLSDL